MALETPPLSEQQRQQQQVQLHWQECSNGNSKKLIKKATINWWQWEQVMS